MGGDGNRTKEMSLGDAEDRDIKPENVWFYCLVCDEEYDLPEDTIACPICYYDDLREL